MSEEKAVADRRPDEMIAHEPAPLAAKVIGLLLAGLAILALGFWVNARGGDERDVAERLAITLLSPAAGDTVASRPVLRFETRARLRPAPEGWRAGRLHIHAVVDGVEHMPTAADLRQIGMNRYEWRLPAFAPGPHRAFLQWSGPGHEPITTGASRAVEFIVR